MQSYTDLINDQNIESFPFVTYKGSRSPHKLVSRTQVLRRLGYASNHYGIRHKGQVFRVHVEDIARYPSLFELKINVHEDEDNKESNNQLSNESNIDQVPESMLPQIPPSDLTDEEHQILETLAKQESKEVVYSPKKSPVQRSNNPEPTTKGDKPKSSANKENTGNKANTKPKAKAKSKPTPNKK